MTAPIAVAACDSPTSKRDVGNSRALVAISTMSDIISASLNISVLTECPQCETQIDLMNQDETSGVDHNEEGGVVSQACPDGCWTTQHQSFKVRSVKCSVCGGEFDVHGLEW